MRLSGQSAACSDATMRALLTLPLLLLLLSSSFTLSKELKDRIDQQEVFEAIPTQLETPPDSTEVLQGHSYILIQSHPGLSDQHRQKHTEILDSGDSCDSLKVKN